jgi:hypothetical protein
LSALSVQVATSVANAGQAASKIAAAPNQFFMKSSSLAAIGSLGRDGRGMGSTRRWRGAGNLSFVIPGRAKREPGIHNHDGEYGFRARAKRRIPE